MTEDTGQLNARWCELVIDELVRLGVTLFCIAPGSRSAPLTLAAARHRAVLATVHVDERGLGFYAVGAARASGAPVAVICTSGTAAANLLPAVVEASMDCVPLLLLTADRPAELRDAGANQTINQPRLFGTHVRWELDLPAPDPQFPPAALRTALAHAIHCTRTPPAGPVHLNFPLREPLLPEPGGVSHTDRAARSRPHTRHHVAPTPQPWPATHPLAATLAAARRGLLIIGRLHDATERAAAESLAEKLGWPTHADIASGLRASRAPASWLRHYDLMLGATDAAPLAPDCVLHLGGTFTSKRLWQHLAATRPACYLRVSADPRRLDPLHAVTDRLDLTVAAFAAALSDSSGPGADPAWVETLLNADRRIARELADLLDAGDSLDEPSVCRAVAREVPADTALFLGSSMPVRDMDAFAGAGGAAVPVGSNRGASGIDGTLASACGHASGAGQPVLFVCGDLALLHDLSSLALLRRQDPPVIVVLINNDGGGIFSFLPVARLGGAEFERYFATPQGLVYADIARAFGIECHSPRTLDEFCATLRAALGARRPALIEVRADRAANLRRHREIEDALRAALRNAQQQ